MTTSLGKRDVVTNSPTTSNVGIYNDNPTLDVGGDVRSVVIPVSGTQTNIDVDTLRVKDKQIELARGEDSTILDDPRLTKQVLPYNPVAATKNLFGETATTDNKRKFEHDRYCKTKIQWR